jgi:hypothetical protein
MYEDVERLVLRIKGGFSLKKESALPSLYYTAAAATLKSKLFPFIM